MVRMATRAVELRVTGRVQGVFFRGSCEDRARVLGIHGWVRNEADGSVHAHAEGDPDAVEEFVDWCHDGPRRAQVDDVEVRDTAPQGLGTFEVR